MRESLPIQRRITMNHRRLGIATMLVWATILVAGVLACRIPVFRYALERWPPGTFELVVAHSGELSVEHAAIVRNATELTNEKDAPANIRITTIDVTDESLSRADRSLLATAEIGPNVTDPQVTLLFPRSRGETTIAWRGELDSTSLTGLIRSPLRQQIVEKLLSGDSAVWILIEGPDAAANDAAAELLETELGRVEELIKLPPQEILQADEEFQASTTIELRIGFELIRVPRDDAQESAFIQMLLNSESDLTTFDVPIAIPVFGRGRTYYALVGKGIKPQLIEANCRFICGDCSCQVKEENPGSDLLFAANWDEGIRGSAFPEQALPELTGIGNLDVIDLAEYERQATESSSERKPVPPTPSKLAANTDVPAPTSTQKTESPETLQPTPAGLDPVPTTAASSRSLWTALLPVIGLAAVMAVIGLFLLKS